jgi:hypothetical protein
VGPTSPWPEEGDRGRRNSQGQKGHFPCFSLLESPEINILFGPVSTSKFIKNHSVYQQICKEPQQIVKFYMFASKEGPLWMSCSKFCQRFMLMNMLNNLNVGPKRHLQFVPMGWTGSMGPAGGSEPQGYYFLHIGSIFSLDLFF